MNDPCGPSRNTLRPGRSPATSSLKSPIPLMVNSLRHGSVAAEAMVKGCSSNTKGEVPIFSQANCPGRNSTPAWPAACSTRVTAVVDSRRTSSTT